MSAAMTLASCGGTKDAGQQQDAAALIQRSDIKIEEMCIRDRAIRKRQEGLSSMKSYFLIIVSSKLSLLPLFFIILRFLSSTCTDGSDGFWNVSMHDESNFGGKETSGTALFVYGMALSLIHIYEAILSAMGVNGDKDRLINFILNERTRECLGEWKIGRAHV